MYIFSDNVSIPNMSCDSSVMAFDIHFGRPHMHLCKAIIFMSNFLIVESEYGIT